MDDQEKKSVLEHFNKQLGSSEKELIKDYLAEKSLESLSRCFDNLIEETDNASQTD